MFRGGQKQYGLDDNSVLLFEVSILGLAPAEKDNAAPLTAAPAKQVK